MDTGLLGSLINCEIVGSAVGVAVVIVTKSVSHLVQPSCKSHGGILETLLHFLHPLIVVLQPNESCKLKII